MLFRRSLLVLALLVGVERSLGQPPAPSVAELKTLRGDVFKGQIVEMNAKEVVFAKGGTSNVAVKSADILGIDLNTYEKIPSDAAYVDVELNCGSILHCSECKIVGKKVTMTLLLTGQKVEVELDKVNNILTKANQDKYRREWTDRVKDRQRRRVKKDAVARLNETGVTALEGLIGEGTADGVKIQFKPEGIDGNPTLEVPVQNIHGLIFFREVDPNAKPPVCKLIDTFQNVVYVEDLKWSDNNLTVMTSSGAKLDYPLSKVVTLDYSNGKLVWLSDITPMAYTKEAVVGPDEHYGRDRNLNKKPIRIKNKQYAKGLSLRADMTLTYDLKGDYLQFKAVLGFDDDVSGHDGPVLLKIEGDGKVLLERTLDRRTWKTTDPEALAVNVKDVQTLRITVKSGDPLSFTLGKHLTLADAKVSK